MSQKQGGDDPDPSGKMSESLEGSPSLPSKDENHGVAGIGSAVFATTVPLYPPPPPSSMQYYQQYPPHPHPPPHPPPPHPGGGGGGGGGAAAAAATIAKGSEKAPPGPYTTAQYEIRKPPCAPIPFSLYLRGGAEAVGSSPKSTSKNTKVKAIHNINGNGIGRDPHHYHHIGKHGEHASQPISYYRDEQHRRRPPPPPQHLHTPAVAWADYNHFYDPPAPTAVAPTSLSYPPPPPPLPQGAYRATATTSGTTTSTGTSTNTSTISTGGRQPQPPPLPPPLPPPTPPTTTSKGDGTEKITTTTTPISSKNASPATILGPYRYSDTTLRREALSNLRAQQEGITGNNNSNSYSDEHSPGSDGRDGATSPSQIEMSHREEVTSMGCTCKKTKCLKLYCQCFAVKIYCGANCRCNICHNIAPCENERQEAIRNILSRNPQAFDTKFKKTLPDTIIAMTELSHKLGCKCRKSACMKKYCECYAGNVRCSESCRCVGCKNNMGAPARSGEQGPNYPPQSIQNTCTAAPIVSSSSSHKRHHHSGTSSLLVAAIAAKQMDDSEHATPGTTTISSSSSTARKQEPYMINAAAQNLAFLKHASPLANKSGRVVPRRTLSQDGDVGSMPSLASSEESPPPPPPPPPLNELNAEYALQQPASALDFTSTSLDQHHQQPNTAEKVAVNALLMAAFAMTKMSSQPVLPATNTNSSSTHPATGTVSIMATPPPDRRNPTATTEVVMMEEDDCKTPQKNLFKQQFQSPKRKQADAEESPGEHKEKDSALLAAAATAKSSHGTMRAPTATNEGSTSSGSSPASDAVSGTGEEENTDDSPKRDNSDLNDITPSLQQKSKRSRIGSVRKGPSRNLGQEMAQGQPTTTTSTTTTGSPMILQTPIKHSTTKVTSDLTPVSARCIDFKRMHVGKGSSPERTGH